MQSPGSIPSVGAQAATLSPPIVNGMFSDHIYAPKYIDDVGFNLL